VFGTEGAGQCVPFGKGEGDAEAMSQLRARHESSIHSLVMEVKKQQLEEAGKAKEALEQSERRLYIACSITSNLLEKIKTRYPKSARLRRTA